MPDLDIAFDDNGLVPCVMQDWRTGEVLTLAYMNAEALRKTLQSGVVLFWRRSGGEVWHMGATSGNSLRLRSLRADCDRDASVALVEPSAPACQTGARSCFFNGDADDGAPYEVLPRLERTIAARAAERPDGSWTAKLLADPALAGAKVEEEAEEVVRAVREESDERVANEAADVIYHLTVLLRTRGLTLADAERVLDERSR